MNMYSNIINANNTNYNSTNFNTSSVATNSIGRYGAAAKTDDKKVLIFKRDDCKMLASEKDMINRQTYGNDFLNMLHGFGFEGFCHTAELENFLSIMSGGKLISRNSLEKNNITFTDVANQNIITKTQYNYKIKVNPCDCCRFFYAPKTPTNYKANYISPVLMVFDENLIYDEKAIFCNMSAAKRNVDQTTDILKAYKTYNWTEIFSRGKYEYSSYEFKNYKNQYRNCEFLFQGSVPVSKIVKVYFKYECDKEKAENILGENPLFVVDSKKFN